MSKFKLFMTALLAISIGVFNYISCKYNSSDIEQPQETIYVKSVIQPLKLIKAIKCKRDNINAITVIGKEGKGLAFMISLPVGENWKVS